MKVLFITEQFPFPLHDGGNLRTYHILRGLAREHDVCLLSHQMLDGNTMTSEGLRRICKVHTVMEPPVWKRAVRNMYRRGIRSQSLYIVKNWSDRLLQAADKLVQSRDFDAIHFNSIDTACFAVERDWRQLKVFDTHNSFSSLVERAGEQASSWLWQKLYAREARQLRHLECAICRRVDRTLVCSHNDAEAYLRVAPGARIDVISNGVDTEFFRPRGDVEEQPGSLVFTGAMSYFPNDEGVLYFSREIMPLLSDIEPSVRFLIAGKDPSKQVARLHDGRTCVVTGEVDDVRRYVEQAQVYVVPLLTGSGTRLKILEAFAMGKAVVSTTQGAEGIPAKDDQELLLADNPQTFARQVRRLVQSRELRRRLGTNARRFVEEKYDWRSVHEKLLGVYREAALRH